MTQRTITFSPPDISQAEIDEVVDTLKSGWITTGPKTKKLEQDLASFIGVEKVACVNSATAALECILRLLGVGPGDEVITSAYTYTASCSPICHVGAIPVLCDTYPGSYDMDLGCLETLITPRTKAIIAVDLGGIMADYPHLLALAQSKASCFEPTSDVQEALGRIAIIADAAHSLGAVSFGVHSGQAADFTSFSFHAVKNFTTAEGGALCWNAHTLDSDALYRHTMLQSLHGQTKDALAKSQGASWEYDIVFPGWKCNMTDIHASLGLAQLRRYPELLAKRRALVDAYERNLASLPVSYRQHYHDTTGTSTASLPDKEARADATMSSSSGHLMMVSLDGKTRAFRDALIEELATRGIATNVHFKALPLLTAYQNLGFKPQKYPCAQAQFEKEISLPLHTLLTTEDIDYICENVSEAYHALEAKGLR